MVKETQFLAQTVLVTEYYFKNSVALKKKINKKFDKK